MYYALLLLESSLVLSCYEDYATGTVLFLYQLSSVTEKLVMKVFWDNDDEDSRNDICAVHKMEVFFCAPEAKSYKYVS
jgi:hypothetical protein